MQVCPIFFFTNELQLFFRAGGGRKVDALRTFFKLRSDYTSR